VERGLARGRDRVVIGFKVAARDSVDALYAELVAAGHAGQQPPYDAFWGARYAVLADPDGNCRSPDEPRRPGSEDPAAGAARGGCG